MGWNPSQYEQFKQERQQPFFDLLSMVKPRPAMRVVDLGCGTGELTRGLHDRLKAKETLGIDRSRAMLAKTKAFTTTGLRFAEQDIESFLEEPDGPWDLVFSNAVLHWVEDHAGVVAAAKAALAPAGQLAVALPLSYNDRAHLVAREVARRPDYQDRLDGYEGYPRPLTLDGYEEALAKAGFASKNVTLRTYEHALASRNDVAAWYRGSFLTGFAERLGDRFEPFYEEFSRGLARRLSDLRPYPFQIPRLFLWAQA